MKTIETTRLADVSGGAGRFFNPWMFWTNAWVQGMKQTQAFWRAWAAGPFGGPISAGPFG